VNAADQPLVLVVCNDAERLTRLRLTLRAAGYLAAPSRSLDAAISLLSQIRVDGCILSLALTEEAADTLRRHLEGLKPGCPKLNVREASEHSFPAWVECSESGLREALARQFAG
jgi:hypothetical protein